MRIIYTFLLYLLLPLILIRLLYKSRHERAYRQRINERFAWRLPPAPTGDILWVHTVSVGEFIAIRPLLRYIIARNPNLSLWISATTASGAAQIKAFQKEQPHVFHSYFPYDTANIINRFLKHLRPKAIIIMETELWPNLLHCAAQQDIDVVVINARLSAKSLRNYCTFARSLFSKLLFNININAQSRYDGKRFTILGGDKNKINIVANLKYHLEPRRVVKKNIIDFKGDLPNCDFIWMAASTHQGEEEIILKAQQIIKQHFDNAILFIAPRHPERRDNVQKIIKNNGYRPVLRSHNGQLAANNDVYLIDTLGELADFYHLVNVAFIGGSLVNHGGHNPLEAIHAEIPICFGNYTHNFELICEEIARQPFARRVNDAQQLARAIIALRDFQGKDCLRNYCLNKQNILEKHYVVLNNILKLQS